MTAPTNCAGIENQVQRASRGRPHAAGPKLFSAVIRPLVITAGIVTAGAVSTAPAQADPPPGQITSMLNGAGFGNNGQMNNALAGVGQSICPMLVQPGANLAQMAAQLSGSTGLPSNIAGMVASMAIQSQCPGFMSSLANGQMPGPLQGLAGNNGPLQGLTGGGPGSNPLQGLGGNPAAPGPLQGLGGNPAAPGPLQMPGANPAPAAPIAPPPGGRTTAVSQVKLPFV
jgi:hypothetical protein